MRKGFLLREEKWSYIQYEEDASGGIELFDMERDPRQFHNLAGIAEYQPQVKRFRRQLVERLREIRDNDL